MARPKKNPYRDFVLSIGDHWTPLQIADALEECLNHGQIQALVLELAGKPQVPKAPPIASPGAATAKPAPLCGVCRFVPAEVETLQGPMCMDCAAQFSSEQSGEDIKTPGKEEDAGRPDPQESVR